MATRPNAFESESTPSPIEQYGPSAPKVEHEQIIASGPLGSRLKSVQGKEIEAPEGKEYIGQLTRRIPGRYLGEALEFLRRLPDDKAEEGAMALLDELKKLGQRIDQVDHPRAVLRKCIEAAEEKMPPTVH